MICTGYQNANIMTAIQCSVNTVKASKYGKLQWKLQSRNQQEETQQEF